MIMRATVERNIAVGTDGYGHPVPAAFAFHATLPCFVWSRNRREIRDADKSALIEDMRAMFPIAADIAQADEISSVKDRAGVELLSGRMRVEAIQRKHRHVEAALERVQ